MTYIQAIILGLVQGLAEFLPISSSGHLALLQYFFGIESDQVLAFTVMLHVGTLLSVFIIYWKDIKDLVVELIATGLYSSLVGICLGLIFTGFILLLAERKGRQDKDIETMKFRHAVFVGIMQGIAICPGVSRSGSTLFGSLMSGLKRELAVKFAFLISIPSILGSVILEVPDALEEGVDAATIGPMIVGVIVAAISGIFAIKAMIRVVTGRRLVGFSIYVWLVAVVVLGYVLIAQ